MLPAAAVPTFAVVTIVAPVSEGAARERQGGQRERE
jgi:hypothetical protein